MNYRLVLNYLGAIAFAAAATMAPALVCAAIYREQTALVAFPVAMAASLVLGFVLRLIGRGAPDHMYQRESLALVGLSWFLVAGLGAIPFVLTGTLSNPVDAYFESMSGFTTTGSSVLTDIESAPYSILFWRSMTQWLGGIGIVVMFIAVLPYLGAGGKQLLKLEAPGPENPSFRPRIRDFAKSLFRLYLAMSGVLLALLLLEGMSIFDAFCHMFSTVSTGGFSPRQASVAAFDNVLIELTLVAFMIFASINFSFYFAIRATRGKALLHDEEVRIFFLVLAVAIALITFNLMGLHGRAEPAIDAAFAEGFEGDRYEYVEETDMRAAPALRQATFQAVSIMTTTGFVTADFDGWPHFSRSMLIVLMMIGGCAGSTAGGIKVVRLIMLTKMAYWRLENTFRPKTIRLVRVGDHVVDDDMLRRLSGFFLLYLGWLLLGTIFLSFFGLPFESSISAVIATMNNIGPGLGLVGAAVDFHLMPGAVKLFLAFCMVLGRLEIFTISVMFIPGFWKHK